MTEEMTTVAAMNSALDLALDRDPKVVLLGEDIADPSGGVFKVTKGLSTKHGPHRVRDPDQRARITRLGYVGGDGDQPWLIGEHVGQARRRHVAHRDKPDRRHGVRQCFCGAIGDDVDRNVGEYRPEATQCGFGDENFDDEVASHRRLNEVRALGEEACGTAPSDVAVQFDRRRHAVGALGERQAASPDGALTSLGSAPFATSTSAVNAAASLTAISARILRSTSTPAALSPWMSRL